MTLYTVFPKKVKVLHVRETLFGYRSYDRWVCGTRWFIGKYFVAEHSRTIGLNAGDEFIRDAL